MPWMLPFPNCYQYVSLQLPKNCYSNSRLICVYCFRSIGLVGLYTDRTTYIQKAGPENHTRPKCPCEKPLLIECRKLSINSLLQTVPNLSDKTNNHVRTLMKSQQLITALVTPHYNITAIYFIDNMLMKMLECISGKARV